MCANVRARWRPFAETAGLQGLSRVWPNASDPERTVSVAIVATRYAPNASARFRSIGVVDQERLKHWAWASTFKDFEGRVKGLGPAVYQWLVMRQGVDTVKPGLHLRRFAQAAVGRSLNDQDVSELATRAAARIGVKAFELDWRIWEASRGGALPYLVAPS
jgi:hypothetical protein